MNNHCRGDGDGLLTGATVKCKRSGACFDSFHCNAHPYCNAEPGAVLYQHVHQVRIETPQRPGTVADNGHAGAGADGEMSKFKGNVARPEEYDLFGKILQFQKPLTGGDQVFAGDMQRAGDCAVGNEEAACGEEPASGAQRVWTFKACVAMKRFNTGVIEGLLAGRGDGFGEGALEAHELAPVDVGAWGRNPMGRHATRPIDQVRRPHQHFLRITAAKNAGAAKGAFIDNGYGPAGFAAAKGGRRRCRAGPDYDEIE